MEKWRLEFQPPGVVLGALSNAPQDPALTHYIKATQDREIPIYSESHGTIRHKICCRPTLFD